MKDFPIDALVAIVNRETAIVNGDIAKYGEPQFDPSTPAYAELIKRWGRAREQPNTAQQAKVKICPWCAGSGRRYYSDVEPDAVCHTCGGTGKLSTVG